MEKQTVGKEGKMMSEKEWMADGEWEALNRDEFWVRIIGNLIKKPKLVEDDDGNKVCYCKIATNPRARRFDPKTGQKMTEEERNNLRTIANIKITKGSTAERFSELFDQGDRVWIEGEGGTRKVLKKFWSEEEGKYISIKLDVDENGKNLEEITEDQLVIRVYKFGKIEQHDDVSTFQNAVSQSILKKGVQKNDNQKDKKRLRQLNLKS
jgi:single-stranded DNA-binding protein